MKNWDKIQIETNIVQFSDGKFFSGIKGKCVRKTKLILDAKRISDDGLDDRDLRYLNGMDYEIIKILYTVVRR